jgi:hypothetical protein
MTRRGGSDVMYDGPRLAAFIEAKVSHPHRELGDTYARALHRWKQGERASEQSVDRVCCLLGWGSHLTAIPHDLIVKGRHLVEFEDEAA